MRRFVLLVSLTVVALVGAGCSLTADNDVADQPPATAATFLTPTSVVRGVVPDVVSGSQRSATITLISAGFVVTEEFGPDPQGGEYEPGQVYAQQPAAGTELQPGSTVTVFVVETVVPVEGVRRGQPVGEPIEPTVALGSDVVWPGPLELADSEAVAQRFASEVLRWEDHSLTADGGVAIDGQPTRFTVRNDTGEGVSLHALPLGSGGWGIDEIGEPVRISAAEQPVTGIQIEIAPFPGVASVVVHIGDRSGETRAWHADLGNDIEPGAIVVPGQATSDIATILILYNDPSGRTLRAAGRPYGSG